MSLPPTHEDPPSHETETGTETTETGTEATETGTEALALDHPLIQAPPHSGPRSQRTGALYLARWPEVMERLAPVTEEWEREAIALSREMNADAAYLLLLVRPLVNEVGTYEATERLREHLSNFGQRWTNQLDALITRLVTMWRDRLADLITQDFTAASDAAGGDTKDISVASLGAARQARLRRALLAGRTS